MIRAKKKVMDVTMAETCVFLSPTTVPFLHEKAQRLGLIMPITAEVYRVLYEDKDPRTAVRDLMQREPTSEGPGFEV